MSTGRIRMDLNEILKLARSNDQEALEKLFSGFLGKGEVVKAGGYLGVLGYILPEHSFWVVTDQRVCGLLLRRGGRMQFVSGYLKLINSAALKQPSLVLLWMVLILWAVFVVFVAFSLSYALLYSIGLPLVLTYILVIPLGVYLSRWVIRMYYRLVKSGCTFWMREKIPVYLFADRQNLVNAQKLMRNFVNEKSNV